MAEVFSIHNEIIKLKQLGLLDAEDNDQSRIDEIVRSMIHSFKEFRCKHKGKVVCSLYGLVSVAADSMMELKSGMMVGETSSSKPKGEKNETKENGKVVVIAVNKARSKSNDQAKWICFYCKEGGKWMRNYPKYPSLKHSGKSFLLILRYMFSKNPPEFLVCGFGTNTCLQLDCKSSRKPKNQEKKRQTLKVWSWNENSKVVIFRSFIIYMNDI
jgi:hypothetical protein